MKANNVGYLSLQLVTEYDEWYHIVRIAMLGLFQDVMRNWRSSATTTLGTDVTLHTTHQSSSARFTSDTRLYREAERPENR